MTAPITLASGPELVDEAAGDGSVVDNATWHPVLQIVHVTDMHVKDVTANPGHPLQGYRRWIARYFKRRAQRTDDWDDGTQGHYPLAPEAFAQFLVRWKARWPAWTDVPVWLVDTGDRTAFGDAASMQAGARYLAKWKAALGSCEVRTLFGNHDAWPGTQPALTPWAAASQQALVAQQQGWDTRDWLAAPLRVTLPWSTDTICLYALNSVCWTLASNVLAIGEVDAASRQALEARLRLDEANGDRGLRILGLHHPVAFPWAESEVCRAGVVPQMRLKDDEHVANWLTNSADDPKGIGPLAHLILSGHTHLSHPAPGCSGDVVDIHQGLLSPYQLQLVGGALMLNKSRRVAQGLTAVPARQHDRFAPSTVDAARCQAQILRFMAAPELPGTIGLLRFPVLSADGTHYTALPGDAIYLHYDTP